MPEQTPASKENQEKIMEALIAPLRELTRCRIFDEGAEDTLWYVTVEWKEPKVLPDGTISLADYDFKKFTATGALNNNFIRWAEKHYQFWWPKAHVPLDVTKVELKKMRQLEGAAW